MLSQNQEQPAQSTAAEGTAPAVAVSRDDEEAVRALMAVIQASPDMAMVDDFAEYLTSPQFLTSPLETPWDDFIPTPALADNLEFSPDVFTSPVMDFDNSDFGNMPLFGDMSLFDDAATAAYKQTSSVPPPRPVTVVAPADFDGLFTMLSPTTPSLDPSSLTTSPALLDAHTFAPSAPTLASSPAPSSSRRKPAPTGTRKNVTPESLIPLDAPIQPRNYLTPSVTSRKDVPATFARKRSRTAAGLDAVDPDDEVMPVVPLDATEEEAIKIKRLQNTLAARRSRKRKLEYQRQLEDELDVMRAEKEAWRERARMLESLLVSHGVEAPALDPAML